MHSLEHSSVAWFLHEHIVNSETGILELKRIPEHEHEHLLRYLERRIARFSAINTLLLQSCDTSLYSTSTCATTSWPNKRAPHHLTLFHGFQSALFKIIAKYADIPIGKPLRRLRDIQAALLKSKEEVVHSSLPPWQPVSIHRWV
jgi:hypothetical protein